GLCPGLFGEADLPGDLLQSWDEKTLLQYEKEALGFYISGHPLSRYRRTLTPMDVNRISDIADKEDRADICVAGIISDIKSKAREKGVTAFLSLEDETGSGDILVYPALYRELAPVLKKGNVVMVRGQVFRAEKGAKIMAREIQDVTDMEVSVKYEVSVKCDTPAGMSERLREIRKLMDFDSNGKDRVSVSFRFYLPGYCVIIASQLQPVGNFLAEVERITGGMVKVN